MQSERVRKMKRNAASMKKYRICKNYGICFSCGEPTKHGHVYCDECLKSVTPRLKPGGLQFGKTEVLTA